MHSHFATLQQHLEEIDLVDLPTNGKLGLSWRAPCAYGLPFCKSTWLFLLGACVQPEWSLAPSESKLLEARRFYLYTDKQ